VFLFIVENELLTPTLKIRRDKIKLVYKDKIDIMAQKFKTAV
jgi:long-subunit acyl-CoA synthetase (AMP-forming)